MRKWKLRRSRRRRRPAPAASLAAAAQEAAAAATPQKAGGASPQFCREFSLSDMGPSPTPWAAPRPLPGPLEGTISEQVFVNWPPRRVM